MFRPHLSYIAAISVNRRTSGYPWRGGPVRSDFQWRLLYPVNLRCLARSGRWRQRSSKWLGMLVIMLWTRCQVLISHLHNSWILNHSNIHYNCQQRILDRGLPFLYGVSMGYKVSHYNVTSLTSSIIKWLQVSWWRPSPPITLNILLANICQKMSFM